METARSNFNIPYKIERDGQIEFFDNYGIPYNDDASILIDNTDGVYNGNIFEFKLNITNLNRTLFQAIKYLSRLRVKGESVPATILLIDLNSTTVYVYKSKDYFDAIHKIYTGAASKNNDGFVAGNYNLKLNYSDMAESAQVKKILKGNKVYPDEMYIPVDIDENCIVGWAERYYREKPNASKGDFLGDDTGTAVKVTGEIRDPRHFKGLINPYTGKSNEKFKYLMDCLNDRLSKKDLGAFYTPAPYAKKTAELVQMAVDRVPEGNDYIILDRCAGCGALEEPLEFLYDKNGDSLIKHCVVSTYEYYEWKVLCERIGDKVRDIIPPSEANVVYENGKVANADAMSKEFIENPIIRQYVDDPKCSIILYENPPYQDNTAFSYTNEDGSRAKASRAGSYISNEFKTKAVLRDTSGSAARDFSNLFIWSGFHYYLRYPEDVYIVFSPLKYWKTVGLGEYQFASGFLFNRKHFHATASAISCICWNNISSHSDRINLDAYDISSDDELEYVKSITVRQCSKTFLDYYDKRIFVSDVETTVWCTRDGSTDFKAKIDTKAIYNDNIIASIGAPAFAPDGLNQYLVRATYCHHGRTFFLRSDNYKTKLPLWVGKWFPQENWYEKDVFYNTSDGGDAYTHDPQFLKSCLIYTCLSNQNKCLSFDGSDGRRYQNELCFDNSKTSLFEMPIPPSAIDELPLALKDLNRYATNKETALDDEEKKLLEVWNQILIEARKTAGYNPEYNYGVYQITKELNTSHTIGTGRSKKTVYDYPVLNGHLDTLRVMLKAYYKSHITAKMFKYQLLK